MTLPVFLIQDSREALTAADERPAARWLRLSKPRRIWTGRDLDQVLPALEAAESWADRGGWSAGFVTYEAAPAFDPALAAHPAPERGLPLFWWAAFDRVDEIQEPEADDGPDLDWLSSFSEARHRRAVEQIHRWIEAGETYQVNLTFPLKADFKHQGEGEPERLFRALQAAQQSRYGAYLDLGDQVIACASPELFFRLDGDRLITRPMKGTSRRGRFPSEDADRRDELQSPKNRAENLMILDMMRNDLGRVAEPGSVKVSRLFHTETYPTVHQLVSEVSCRTDASRLEILQALFPCASITGAPKIRTTELIRRLETEPRGLYTGSLGFFGPDRVAQMNVAIRTAVVDRAAKTARYGTGGGIVWDSVADREYAECRSKSLILSRRTPAFDLLETLVWRPKSGFFLLDLHLERLERSARFFDRPFDAARIRAAFETLAGELLQPKDGLPGRHRIRLTVDARGEPSLTANPMPCDGRRSWKAVLDDRPIDNRDVFLFHKTTHREVYERARERVRERHPDADEVLLWNAEGLLTELTVGNLLLRIDGRWLTPDVEAGLLAGTYRQHLLDQGKIETAPLTVESLTQAGRACLINSVRGWIPLQIEAPKTHQIGTNPVQSGHP